MWSTNLLPIMLTKRKLDSNRADLGALARWNSVHSLTFPSLHLSHNSFSNPSVALPTSQLILQPFRCFTYVTVHSPTLLRFSYVTSSSLNSPGEPPMSQRYICKMATPVYKSFCVLQFAATAIPKTCRPSGRQKFLHGNATYTGKL